MKYVPLYIKTDNSLQGSLITVQNLISYAKEAGFSALGIADANMYGVMDFYMSCKKNNIKPIVGLEITYNNLKIVLYCMNYNGYKNLLKLTTISSEKEIEIKDLEQYSSDLICLLPYQSLTLFNEVKGMYQYVFKTYRNAFEKHEAGSNIIYMNETIYLKEDTKKFVKYLDAMREGITIDLVNGDRINNNLKSIKELEELGFIDGNEKIYELCNLEIAFNQELMPIYENDEGIDSYSYLKKKCIEGLKLKFGSKISSKYQERLKLELDVIKEMGFCDYFLIVYDYIKYSKENNIIVGPGRGSAVGSLVAYCLNIIDIDPLKYDLLFERFLNIERISMPDIDIDFEHSRREDVIEYCRSKYGAKKVAPIITFGTMGAKQAIRDVGRAMDLDLSLIDGLCKVVSSRLTLDENFQNQKVQTYLKRYDGLEEVYKIARVFEGLKRHTSIHAAGIVMSRNDLDDVIPLDKAHQSFYTSGYDMKYLEEIGLLKMDFLAIKYLTIIHQMIDEVNKIYKINLTFDNIPFDDEKAYEVFKNSNTLGIFQFESDGMINFLTQLKANNFDDVCAAIALFRPGPMQNIPAYIKRKNGNEKIDYLHETLEPILKSTYGIMIYQEQIMQIAAVMADYTLGEADILRKAMSKKQKDLLLKEEEKFTERALKKGYESNLVNKVYKLMLKFAEYGFNKSHSVGYSLVSYRMAYLKAYYPQIFMSNLLSIDMNDSTKAKKYIYECRKNNIEILKPDINLSMKIYNMEELGIRYPLTNIKNVGIAATSTILEERKKGKFKDIYDFIKRCYGKSVNKKTVESLIDSGCFTVFGYNRNTLNKNLDAIINYGELIKDLDEEFTLKPEFILYEEYNNQEIMEKELELFGIYLSRHPITEVKLNYKNIVPINELPNYFDKIVDTIVYVDRIKEVNTKKNQKMAFISGSDELSTIDVTLFPNLYEKNKDISKGDILLVQGRVEKRFDKYQLVVVKFKKLK
jgi:DNA-directed DNA polymerase III (polc)